MLSSFRSVLAQDLSKAATAQNSSFKPWLYFANGHIILQTALKFTGHSPSFLLCKNRKENPQKLTQLSSRSHPRHLVGKKTAQKDTIIDITSDSQVNSNFPYRWSPASLTFNNYFYLFFPPAKQKRDICIAFPASSLSSSAAAAA